MLPKATEAVIVGAGPTGLVLANRLASRGVEFVIVDRLPRHGNASRAAVVHARTLERLEELGLAGALVERGVKVPRFTVRDRDRTLLTIDFGKLPTKYPYTLMIPQGEIEEILENRLRERGHRVHRGVEARDVAQQPDGATVALDGPDGRATEIRAQYVVGADGLHSLVREKAGIRFLGGTYGQSFILADVHMDWALDPHEVMLFFSPAGLVVVAPLPHALHRIVATVDDAPDRPNLADLQAILDARGPKFPAAKVTAVTWSSRFRVHHRIADRYRVGRLFIAGDAAHVHSPAGGQGMNIGIQDACTLGRLLCDVVTGRQPSTVLDAYETRRRPAAESVVRLTDRLTRIATMKGPVKRTVRNGVIRVLDRVAPFKHGLAMRLAELNDREGRRAGDTGPSAIETEEACSSERVAS